MRRTWLTSTTALALVLNAAAPIPGAALGTTDKTRSESAPQLMRLAQTEAEALQDNTAADAIEGAVDGVVDEATQQAAEAEAEALAAENAAKAAAQQAEEEAAAAQQQAADDAAAQQAAETEAQQAAEAAAEADAAAEAQAQADSAAAQQAADEAAAAEQQAIDDAAAAEAEQQAIDDAAAAEAEQQADEADAAATAEAEAEVDAAVEQQAAGEAASEAEPAQPAEDAASAEADSAEGDQAAQDAATTDDAAKPAAAEDAATAEPADPTVVGQDSAPATDQAAVEVTETEAADVGAAETSATETTTDTAEAPEVSAEAQANALAEETGDAPAAAAASGEGEVVDTQEGTVTEDQARASNEEFATTASGQQTVATPVPVAKKKDNDLLKAVGIVAAAGLGAYAVGKLLNNGGEVVSNTGDRAVVRDPNGQYRIIKDDDTLLRQPGSNVATQTYSDGSTRTEVVARDNSSTVTIRAADGRVLRRTRILPDGQEVLLFDDTRSFDRVDVTNLRPARESDFDYSSADTESLRAALSAKNEALPDRAFSLNQIRRIDAVRKLVPVIALDAINFRTGSAVIEATEAQDLSDLGDAMRRAIEDDPAQVFLIEGHTDTVGDASYNLALSDRRAESVALALTEYFDVPPANMIVQGYGEADLRIKQAGDVRGNRRGAVRNITPLLTGNR